MGTVNYMSPEQAQGKQVNHRTDLWSLGVCLYEMLSGRLPFSGKTINHTLVAIMETKPLPLSQINRFVPVELEHIITKLLAKEPKHRYQTANNLLADLRELQKRIETEPHQAETKLFKATKIKQFSEEKTIEKSVREITSDIAAPNNLSGQFSPLIGREKEISEITNLLKGDSIRLLTLTGIGGTGKTRLAYKIAAEMLSEFVDGVFFIALAAVRNAEFVASEIAQPLGVKESGGKSLLETLKDFLREKQILLVIDNFEQILSAAPVLNELLANAPRVQMLVTSRALLHLRVEREFIVPPLDVPSDIPELSADDLLQYESVKLFTERAQAVKSNLAATKKNLQIIAEICSRLDGLPLAIELAAARVKILSPSAILARLENSLKLLTGGSQDLPAHQQTMRGAIEWSFDLLEADEKILFRRLAVFTGGFTIEAAESVVLRPLSVVDEENTENNKQRTMDNERRTIDVLDGITSLVDKSLLVQKEQADGESRFRLLEVVREYALEILESGGESDLMKKNHAAFFLALAKEAEPHFFDEQGTNWLNRLEEEHDNLRAALAWSASSDAETAINLAAAIRTFWILHNHLTEGRKWLETALERSDDAPSALRFKLLHGLGQAAMYQGDTETARKMYEESLAVSKAAGDKRQIALSNRGLGALAKQQGDFTTARKFIEEGLKISRELNDKFGIAVSLNNLGDLARMEGDYAAARPLFEESLAISRQLGNKEGICGIYNNLAAITFGEDDFAAAHLHYAEALAMAQELGDKITVSYSLDGFAALAVKSGDTKRAAQIAGAAEHLRESLGFDTEPAERRFRDAYLVELQTVLDKENFAVFYEQGRTLSLKKAVALALQKSNAGNGEAITSSLTPNKNPNAVTSIAVLPFSTSGLTEDEESETLINQLTIADPGIARPTSSAEYIIEEVKRHKRGTLIFLAILALILTSAAAFYFYNTNQKTKISSIAVLPFQNASGDAGLEYLSDGLSENLTNKLAQIGQLKVIAQSSAFRYKNKEIDPKEARQTLGVEALLTGKITKSGDNLSIRVELINARDGTIIWNEKYNLDSPDAATDTQLVQNRIALQIVKNLNINLTDIQDKQLTKYATQNAQAYQLYLNAALLKRKNPGIENTKKTVDFYNQAIALDPNFALAYASLANSYRLLQYSVSNQERKEIEEKMYQAIARAQELDATLPEVYTTLGGIKMNELDFPASEQAYKRAVELSPNSSAAHSGYANYLTNTGRFDEALTQIGIAEQLDPLSFNLKVTEGRILFAARRYDEAIRYFQNLAKTAPDNSRIHFILAESYTFKSMYREALAEFEKSKEKEDKYNNEFYLFALAKSGKIVEARQELEKLKKRESYSPAEFAVAYVALGEKGQALDLLEKAFDERDPQLQFLKIEPGYDDIRAEPRFQELLRKVGF